jgi:hypothetical protein
MPKLYPLYGRGQAIFEVMPPAIFFENAPTSINDNYAVGQEAYTGSAGSYTFYKYLGAGVWIETSDPDGSIQSITGTANQITASTTAGDTTLTLPVAITAPGSVTATTTLTATLGAITATNGNFVKGTAGNKDVYSSVATNATAGANSAGTVTLVGGTATVATTAVTANSLIRIYRQGIGSTGAAALGILTIGTITASTSFVINSVQAANATALQATDVSVVFWEIVN